MRKVELTEKQREVVRNRGGNLLVSAAAGAGKQKSSLSASCPRW